MKHTETLYAVQLKSEFNPKPHLAVSSFDFAGPHLFYWRSQAVAFKNALLKGSFKTARVVRVEATYTWEAKP